MKESITVATQKIDIEIKPITLLVPSHEFSAGPRIDYPSRLKIDTDATVHHARNVKKLHKKFIETWKTFMLNTSCKEYVKYEITADNIRTFGMGSIHLMGLIDLSLKFKDINIPFVWVYPESFLHPSWHGALVDLAISLSEDQDIHSPEN